MNKLFKYLGAFAIAGAIGLNTMDVKAELTCAADETVHTNYYMFLDVGPAADFKTVIEAAPTTKPFTHWTGAQKYNNINNKNGENGDINISGYGKNTSASAAETWTVEEFWQRFYTAYYNRDGNNVYEDTNNNTSYMTHDEWTTYEEGFTGGASGVHANADRMDALMAHLKDNLSNLSNSQLVKTGTSIPKTEIIIPNDLWTKTGNGTFEFRVKRTFSNDDIKDGVSLINTNWIYSPAVHYAKFCVKNTSTSTKKTITYDANTTEPVASMPGNQEFTDSCTSISSQKPTRSGYTFLGWSATAESTLADNQYDPGKQYCGGSIILHAIWSPNQSGPFTVEYFANGGKGAPAKQEGNENQCVTISTQKPTLSGNNFLGWSRNERATEPDKMFAPGTDYCGGQGSIKLYAVWQTQTGVSAHLMAFSVVAIAAGAVFLAAKKKDLFKQI